MMGGPVSEALEAEHSSWVRKHGIVVWLVGGTERPPMVVHLPGVNEETVRHTPLLELYDDDELEDEDAEVEDDEEGTEEAS